MVKIWKISEDLVRVLLANTIETYPPEWRLLHEPLQNAIDSFIDEEGNVAVAGERKVELELYLGSNLVVVRDNGGGVPHETFSNFFYLGGGTKGKILDAEVKKLFKGSQGVGIKSTVFTSEVFELTTVHKGQRWGLTFEKYYKYLDPTFTGDVVEPIVEKINEKSGTQVRIRLFEYTVWDFVRERVEEFFSTAGVDTTNINEKGQVILDDGRILQPLDVMRILMRYFKKESYVGDVARLLGNGALPPITFSLKVICDFSKADEQKFQLAGIKALSAGATLQDESGVKYLDYPTLMEQVGPKERPKIVTGYREILEAGVTFNEPVVFHQILKPADVQALLGSVRKRRPTDPPGNTANVLVEDSEALARISRHKTALSRVNGAILFIASRKFLKSPLVHKSSVSLSVNGLPTDIILEVTGAELGYLPATHLVLDVHERLGYGKRNLAPKSKGIYNHLAKDLWKTIHKLAKYVISEDEDYDRSASGKHFEKPEEQTKLVKDQPQKFQEITGRVTAPETKEDVIATYFHMVGKGLLKRYNWLRLSDYTVYDGLAFPPGDYSNSAEQHMLIVEFKRTLLGLCEADEHQLQNFEEIDLGIVWRVESSENLPPDYSIINKEKDLNYKGEYFPDANYRVKHGKQSVVIIGLEEIVKELIKG